MVVRYCFIYILEIKKYQNYFFILVLYYDNKSYSYEFIYLFLLKKLIKFVGFITPVVERWLIQLKSLVAAPVLFVLTCLTLTARLLRSWWWGSHYVANYRGIANSIYTFFPNRTHEIQKALHQAGWLDVFIFYIVSFALYLIHFETVLFIFLDEKSR